MIRIWIAMMLALLLLAGCGGEKDAGYVARKLDIVLPQPAAVIFIYNFIIYNLRLASTTSE